MRADDIWLSPDYGRTSCHITITLYNPSLHTATNYFNLFHEATSRVLELSPRVHWGKFVTGVVGPSDVGSMYPRLSDFSRIRSEMDPHSIFINQALTDMFGFE